MREPRTIRRRGLTLAEVAVSVAIMSLLFGSLMSAILISSHALPNANDPSQRMALATDTMDMITSDLATAATLIAYSSTAIEFTVPDRGHGPVGAETIRYEWSGTPGQPLTRQYNEGALVTIAESVQAFSLAYAVEAGTLKDAPRVLLVSRNPGMPSARDAATKLALESAGYSVLSIADSCTAAQFAAGLSSCNVVYVLPEVSWTQFGDKPTNIAQGVVVADTELYSRYGIASSSSEATGNSVSFVLTTPHPVSQGFSGSVQICSANQSLAEGSALPGGAAHIAWGPALAQCAFFAVDWNGALVGGGTAVGRRIAVASGTVSFDYTTLTAEGARLERNAILWAAAPRVITRISITLQLGTAASGRIVSDVQLLNQPRVPG